MWSTFRQIGSRSNRQGGASFNTLSVNNRLSVSCPFLIGDNLPLTDSILRTLQQNSTILIQNAVQPLRNHVEAQYVSPDYIADLIRSWVSSELINNTTVFVPTVNITFAQDYSTNTALDIVNSSDLINDKTFPENAATLLAPYVLNIIQDPSFLSTIMDRIFERLLQEADFRFTLRASLRVAILTDGSLDTLIPELVQTLYPIDSIFPTPSFQVAMRYLPQATPIQIYDNSNVLVKTIAPPDCTNNGFIQYSMDKLTWSISLKYIFNTKVVSTSQFATYLACNVNGPVTLNTPLPITNSYNGGIPIMVAKFNPDGNAAWISNIFSTGAALELIKGIVSDPSGNVYVFGSHPAGNNLFITDTNGCIYLNPIDNSPFYDPTTGLPNESNAYIIKYDPNGVLLGIATLKGVYTQTIESVFIDPVTNIVYVAGSSTSLQYGPTLRGFNNEVVEIPNIGRAFIVAINNVGSDDIVPYYAILASGVIIDTSFEQRDVPGSASAVQVGCDALGYVFALFSVTYENFALYAPNSVSSFQTLTMVDTVRSMVLVSYNAVASSIEFINLFSSNPSVSNNHQFCVTTIDQPGFFGASFVSGIFFNCNVQNTLLKYVIGPPEFYYYYDLPVGVSQAEFIFQIIEAESGLESGVGNVVISNSTIFSMQLSDRVIYVGFSYTDVCNIYKNIYDDGTETFVYQITLTVSGTGESGTAVVKFDTGLQTPTLVSNYTT
jgi:hypothetical protein